MAKLTKKQRKELESILYHIKRAVKYLKRDDVVGIATKTDYPNGASYQIINPECSEIKAIDSMNKNIGSDITGLYTASQLLESFLGSD
jgi:hypothetical protein